MTQFAETTARLVKELCGERTCTHTSAVSLDNTHHTANAGRSHTKAGADTGGDCVGRGYKRIGAEIDVEHRALGTFGQNFLTLIEAFVDKILAIN
jgi:hypothetical protein